MDTVIEVPKIDRLNKLRSICHKCCACRLSETRSRVVFGEGNSDALIMLLGEGPGRDEDLSGRPFVGRSGQLLRKMLWSIGLNPEGDCFISNVVKCRPPANRPPEKDEIDLCVRYFLKQIEIIQPSFLVLFGKTAVKGLFPDLGDMTMYDLRSKADLTFKGIKALVTYHPSALLRDPKWHAGAKDDFKKIKEAYSEAAFYRKTLEGETCFEGVY